MIPICSRCLAPWRVVLEANEAEDEALGLGHNFPPHRVYGWRRRHYDFAEEDFPFHHYHRPGHGHGHNHARHREDGARRDRLERQYRNEINTQREAEDARRRHRDDGARREQLRRRGEAEDARRHRGYGEERVMR